MLPSGSTTLTPDTNELTCPQCDVPMSELSLVAAQATAPSVTLPISVLMWNCLPQRASSRATSM